MQRQFRNPAGLASGLKTAGGCAMAALGLASAVAAPVMLAAAPAMAVDSIYVYNISGKFGNNTGPNSKGTFTGRFIYDTTAAGSTAPVYSSGIPTATINDSSTLGAGYTPGTGTGGFSYWSIQMFDQNGNPYDSFLSTRTGGPPGGARCYGGPVAKGGAAIGTYYEGMPGAGGANYSPNTTGVCSGSPVFHDLAAANAPDATAFFAIHEIFPHSWTATGSTYTANFNYFRIPLQGTPGNFSAMGGNSQAQEYFGWMTLGSDTGATATDAQLEAGIACTGSQNFPAVATTLPICPASGNNINLQGLNGTLSTDLQVALVPEGAPAPLPLAGALPLGVALRRLSGKRSRLLSKR